MGKTTPLCQNVVTSYINDTRRPSVLSRLERIGLYIAACGLSPYNLDLFIAFILTIGRHGKAVMLEKYYNKIYFGGPLRFPFYSLGDIFVFVVLVMTALDSV